MQPKSNKTVHKVHWSVYAYLETGRDCTVYLLVDRVLRAENMLAKYMTMGLCKIFTMFWGTSHKLFSNNLLCCY